MNLQESILTSQLNTVVLKETANKNISKVNRLLKRFPSYTEVFEDCLVELDKLNQIEDNAEIPQELVEDINDLFDNVEDTIKQIYVIANTEIKEEKEKKEKAKLANFKLDQIKACEVLDRIEGRITNIDTEGNFTRNRTRDGKEISLFRSITTLYKLDNTKSEVIHYSKEGSKLFLDTNSKDIVQYFIEDEYKLALAAWKTLRTIKAESNLISKETFKTYKDYLCIKEIDEAYKTYYKTNFKKS